MPERRKYSRALWVISPKGRGPLTEFHQLRNEGTVLVVRPDLPIERYHMTNRSEANDDRTLFLTSPELPANLADGAEQMTHEIQYFDVQDII